MTTKTPFSQLLAVVLLFTAGCSSPWELGGGTVETFLSADVTGGGNARSTQGEFTSLAPSTADSNSTTPEVTREIEEADMVKVIDHTLFVLNQYRGLRIIDVTDWAKPTMKGTFDFLGRPVEMYVDNGIATIIVANDGACRLDATAQVFKQSLSTVYLVDVSNLASPREINAFGVDGYVHESRRVGDVVYLAGTTSPNLWTGTNGYTAIPDGFVASVFVADPLKVQLVDQKTLAGQGQYLHATQNAIFVAGVSWQTGKTTIQYVDISDPAGTIALRGTCEVPGQIIDRFSMDANETAGKNVLRVVADKPRWFGPREEDGQETQSGVTLYTFDLTDPNAISPLGKLFIIKNETLMAVRFDGLKGYVVTFEQRDPLWVVDLADPADPKITGYLEAPGYSTYLAPDGDRLVAVGLDDSSSWRASIMLYDVADPANPKELDREILGQEYSSSQANYDEKAFKVIPEAHLILVPFNTWTDGYKNKLAMIDYSNDTLTNLAQIDHRGTAERSGVDLDANVLWVVSQNALQTLNIADRTSPQQLATMTLAENILAYKPVGQYGLRLVSRNNGYEYYYFGYYGGGGPDLELQVVNAADPNGSEVLSRLSVAMYGTQLYIPDSNNSLALLSGYTQSGKVKLAAVDLSALPDLTLAGEKEFEFTLTGGYYSGGYCYDIAPSVSSIMPAWYGGGSKPSFLANRTLAYLTWAGSDWKNPAYALKMVSFADPADIKVVGEMQVTLEADETLMRCGSSGNTIYLSTARVQTQTADFFDTLLGRNDRPMARFYVRRIDCTDPAAPQATDPVNVPGTVVGVQGDIAYTIDPQWMDNGIGTSFCAIRLGNETGTLLSKVDLPAGNPGEVKLTDTLAVLTIGPGYYGYGGYGLVADVAVASVAKTGDTCSMGSFRLMTIRIADPNNLAVTTDTEYPGSGQIAGIADSYVIGQISYPNQALIWQIADDESLTFKHVVDLPGYITDLSISNGLLNLTCGYGGILQITPNP